VGLGLDPNPASPGSILSLSLKGSTLWTGGGDAMNGSLATAIVLAIIVATLVATRASANEPMPSAPPAGRRSGFAP
jgi:hypothetical protein